MRIITGEFRGRKLETPLDYSIRPTTDKVKEALFSIIAPYVPDSVFADIFAGTGNLGLEALSRGAAKCYFGDRSRDSIKLIKRNIDTCRVQDRAFVIPGEYQKVLSSIHEKVDVFLLDPPYKEGLMTGCITMISDLELLDDEGIIVAEHGKEEELPDEIGCFTKQKERKYGNIVITIYG